MFLDVVFGVCVVFCFALVPNLAVLFPFLLSLLVLGCAGRLAAANARCGLGCGALLPCTVYVAGGLEKVQPICLVSLVGKAPTP